MGLNHIHAMIGNNSPTAEIDELLENRIHEEEEAILKHRQNITRLTLQQLQRQRTETYQKDFSIQPFPRSYILDERSSSQEIIFRWFQLSRDMPGLDMSYFYDEYKYLGDTTPPAYVRSRLLLYEDVGAVIPAAFDLPDYPLTPVMDCVCYSYTASALVPPSHQIQEMAAWAAAHGYHIQGTCFATNTSSRKNESARNYEVEIYLPIHSCEHR